MAAQPSSQRRALIQWAGLLAGPLAAVGLYLLLPTAYRDSAGDMVALSSAARMTLAVMVWMALWWLTEAIDISATALLPLAIFPLLGIASIQATAAPYASDLIFLFMGGFILALSMQRWGLDRRVALVTLRLVGTRPANMVGGFMLATAVLSAFISNTATTAMMLPIALSVIDQVRRQADEAAGRANGEDAPGGLGRNFALCLMLGIAYAASIGGVATIIGTPPNAFLVGFLKETIDTPYRMEISFARWMGIGLPVSGLFLPIAWLLLTRVLYPIRVTRIAGGRSFIGAELAKLGPMKPGEWVTLVVFLLTAAAWMGRAVIAEGLPGAPDEVTGEPTWIIAPLMPGLKDSGIAMMAAMLLFLIPVNLRSRTFAMNWATARQLPWGILILFGGGLSLAAAVTANGVAKFIGSMAGAFQGAPDLLLILLVTTLVIFLTELTSNTATTTTLLPILAALAPGLGVHPYLLIVPAAIAASCAFMMPVATPPNAIVFGSGYVTIPQMCKAGWWLNFIGIVLVTSLVYTTSAWLLGV